jgi:hypothetical protein
VDGPIVFRNSPLAVLAAIAFMVCFTPVALTVPGMEVLYLIPIGMVAWVLRVRTTVDADTIAARGALRTRRVAWGDVTALHLRTRSRVSVVLGNGPEVPLPAVRVRDLPLLAMMSGGRLPDPSPDADQPDTGAPAPATTVPDPTVSDTSVSDTGKPAAPARPASPEE